MLRAGMFTEIASCFWAAILAKTGYLFGGCFNFQLNSVQVVSQLQDFVYQLSETGQRILAQRGKSYRISMLFIDDVPWNLVLNNCSKMLKCPAQFFFRPPLCLSYCARLVRLRPRFACVLYRPLSSPAVLYSKREGSTSILRSNSHVCVSWRSRNVVSFWHCTAFNGIQVFVA